MPMNIQPLIRPDLWLAISKEYEAGNFRSAILDAMHFVSNVLRGKAGIDGDGVSLVGQALGGESPLIRVNRLQTQTERDVQKGLQQILTGLYQAIRNPRSHEQSEDTQQHADAIIFFIDYITSVLDQSKEPFTLEGFLQDRVFDADFVEDTRYAELMMAEIPANKRLDMLIEIYRRRANGNGAKLKYTIQAILSILTAEQITEFLIVVSDDMKTVKDDDSLISALQILPAVQWPQISEVARLRIENKLIASIREGREVPWDDSETVGILGTWARGLLQHFSLKEEAGRVLAKKINSRKDAELWYAANYFMRELPVVATDDGTKRSCISGLCKAVRDDDPIVRADLVRWLPEYPTEWQKEITEGLKDLTDPNNPEIYLPDGTPFLKVEEEIPF